MKKLLDRLKDEHVIVLHHLGEEFPHSIDALFEELKNNTHWIDLSYWTVCYLKDGLNLPDHSPATVSKLFNDHEKD
jgi:hypothetical protein